VLESMQPLFTLVLTASVLVHAAFGCCLHHAHACETDCCDSPTAAASDCSCHGHDKVCESASNSSVDSLTTETEQPSRSKHECKGVKCNLGLISSSSAQSLQSIDAPPAIFTIPDREIATTSGATYANLGKGTAPIGLRPHLFLAILLI